MTVRLYYTDAGARTFDAVVVSSDIVEGRAHVVLDRTAFYPTSGGQPFDTGRLGGASVVDVFDAESGDVVHVLASPLAVGETVRGEIDGPRRLDHVQQHTGQHLLSAAFDRLLGVRTMSFHMGSETSTIDLAREVSADEIRRAEAEANRVVWDDRTVHVRFVTEDEARVLPLRKEPARSGPLRLVEIEDFDLSACGGTHADRTGVVGMIAVAGWERVKGATRVTFVCGGRALHSHGVLRDVVLGAIRVFSVTPSELGPALERAQEQAKDLDRTVRRLRQDLAAYRAKEFREAAETIGRHLVVLRNEPDSNAAELKALAAAVVSESSVVAVLVGSGHPVPVVVARSAGVDVDAAALVRDAAAALGGRGGGKPEAAQGGLTATPDQVIEFVRRHLSLSSTGPPRMARD